MIVIYIVIDNGDCHSVIKNLLQVNERFCKALLLLYNGFDVEGYLIAKAGS